MMKLQTAKENKTMTNKKTIYSILGVFALILAVGAGSAYAKNQILKNNVISIHAAKNFAFVDAGINEKDVTGLEVELEKEHGAYYYDVDFVLNGEKYSYHIDATNGQVRSKDVPLMETVLTEERNVEKASNPSSEKTSLEEKGRSSMSKSSNEVGKSPSAKEETPAPSTTKKPSLSPEKKPSSNAYLSIEKVKDITLKNSGINPKEAIFETTKLEREDGKDVYEVEFFTGNTEYNYEVDAHTGEILQQSFEPQNKVAPSLIKEKQILIEKLDDLDDDDFEDRRENDVDDDDDNDDRDFDDDDNDEDHD